MGQIGHILEKINREEKQDKTVSFQSTDRVYAETKLSKNSITFYDVNVGTITINNVNVEAVLL